MKAKSLRARLLYFAAILILVLVLLYSGLQILESTVLHTDNGAQENFQTRTIYRDGKAYYPRLDITTILLAGVDTKGPMVSSGSYNNDAEADMVSVLIFDNTNKKVDIISLNRDTMIDVPMLGVGGKPAGTRRGQLALAHTYGSGMKDSSENLSAAVSDLLYGLRINHYVTMNMDAIAVLNDAVGGVVVDVTEDFSQVDPTIGKGKVRLNGQQATNYVRLRYGVDDQMNLGRMERQEKYLRGFSSSLDAAMEEDVYFLVDAFEQVSQHMVTSCTATTLAGLIDDYADYQLGEMITIEGENVKGKEFMEYHLDEEDLDRVVLQYLYAPK